jgi:hypothetical protein
MVSVSKLGALSARGAAFQNEAVPLSERVAPTAAASLYAKSQQRATLSEHGHPTEGESGLAGHHEEVA